MLIIGERINSTRPSIRQAIESGDKAFIQKEALSQAEAGADYIDVNAGGFIKEEKDKLIWLVETVQEITDVPLCLDSPDPEALKAVLPLTKKEPLINSFNLEPSRLDGILPLAAEYKTGIIGLCQSESGMAVTTEDKVRMAGQLIEKAGLAGIPVDRVYVDPLVFPISTDTNSSPATLEAINKIMTEFPGVHTTCGLTNISHGLPARRLVNRTFLTAAVIKGLDSAIMDPTDKELYGALKAAVMIAGSDEYCLEYLDAYRMGRLPGN